MRKSIKIEYEEYDSVGDLSATDSELLQLAMDAAEGAYSPYSQFRVGAAVRLDDGKIVVGNNQENAAYPSGLCAERVALFSALAQNPSSAVSAIAIVGRNGDGQWCEASPCGACRQVMAECESRSGRKITIILYAEGGKAIVLRGIDSVLPFRFSM